MTIPLLLLALLGTPSAVADVSPTVAGPAQTASPVAAEETSASGETGAGEAPIAAEVAAEPTPAPAAARLAQVVLLARHGVRSPIEPMQRYAAQAFPKWPVAAGALTEQGHRLVVLLAADYRRRALAEDLLPAEGCPRDGVVWLWADTVERDVLTAQALAEGLLPGCSVAIKTAPAAPDPLFHALEAGVCQLDAALAREAILGRIGDAPAALTAAERAPLATLQRITGCCQPKVCEGPRNSCTIFDLAAAVVADEDSGTARLAGPIAVGSILAEDLMLAYADGRPAELVGWGRASAEAIVDVARLHTLQFDLDHRTHAIARARASGLAVEIAGALEQGASGRKVPRVRAPSRARFVAYVGHDVNIANLGGLLGLEWLNESWQRNQTPPGGALVFELWRPADDGDPFVRAFFVTQTLAQLRGAEELGEENPPSRAPILVPGCGFDCPLETFATVLRTAADPACARR